MKPKCFLIFEILAFVLLILTTIVQAQNKVEDRSLFRRNNTNIIVTFTESLSTVLSEIKTRNFPSRGQKIQTIKNNLQAATRRYHSPVLRRLKTFGVQAKSFWITNSIYVKGSNPRIVTYLNGLTSVRSIREERRISVKPVRIRPGQQPADVEWGVKRIGAPQVWNETRGEGVIVAIIDTGVNGNHEALKDNYSGLWFDATSENGSRTLEPEDNDGHGTHCTGTVCGSGGIGVAPGAKWAACRACDVNEDGQTTCPDSSLLMCMEWVLCPESEEGNNGNCSMAPHVVSNSWGGGSGDPFFNEAISTWEAAGIFNVFAIMNDGPDCLSAMSPGDQPPAFSCGATDSLDTTSHFSGRGPSQDGRIVPNIVAPGVDILSAYNGGDDDYRYMDGTSMSTPHVLQDIFRIIMPSFY